MRAQRKARARRAAARLGFESELDAGKGKALTGGPHTIERKVEGGVTG